MRRPLSRYIAAALVGAAFLGSSPASAARLSVRALAAHELRVATIGYRIGAANAGACTRPAMMTGMVLHDLTQYRPGARAAVSKAFSLHSGFGVLAVVPGSVAEAAGLQVDDEILAVANVSVEDSAAIDRRPQSYRRMDHFVTQLERSLEPGATSLSIRRGGQLLRVHLRGQPGCGGRPALTDSSRLNAWSDGRRIVLSTGMTNFAQTDHELAFVVAHEMAHNILEYRGVKQRSRDFLGPMGLGFGQARRTEGEADAYAIGLMSNAGYSGQGATLVLEKLRRRLWWHVSLDHPGFGRRIQIVTAAIANLRRTSSPQLAAQASADAARATAARAISPVTEVSHSPGAKQIKPARPVPAHYNVRFSGTSFALSQPSWRNMGRKSCLR